MKSRFVSQWIDDFLRDRPVRANSLIITVYGDIDRATWRLGVAGQFHQPGQAARHQRPIGQNQRVPAVEGRLARTSEHIGRRSYYGLTSAGRRRFEHAYRRIYFQPKVHWEGDWLLVLDSEQRLVSPRSARKCARNCTGRATAR
jgi:phenylacetic acid degradation operon negative regulatory protein